MKVAIVGTGYVGLSTGACLAFLGNEVTCLDVDEAKIDALKAGRPSFYEPLLPELLAEAKPNLRFTTSYDEAIPGAEVVFIAVGTPPQPNGSPDLTYLRAAAQSIGQNLGDDFTVVVNKSTVPIGSSNWVEALIRESFEGSERSSAGAFAIASNPEFLREGSALHDSLYPDRVVIGSNEPAAKDTLSKLYRPVAEQSFAAPTFLPRPEGLGAVPVVTADLASAELIKYAANAFLALKISYVNEIAKLAERVGADIKQVAKGIGLDARIGTRFLQAGIGWGGSCFGKDTAALISTADEYGLSMPIVSAAREVNECQRALVVEKLLTELKILKGRTIGLLGLAFKPHTDDLRESPAIDIARRLRERGASVRAHDPIALEHCRRAHPDLEVRYCAQPEQTFRNADAVVLVTDWPQYRNLNWKELKPEMRTPILLDGRNFLDQTAIESAGIHYIGIGG